MSNENQSIVWADEATPFTGRQVAELLSENERLRAELAAAHVTIETHLEKYPVLQLEAAEAGALAMQQAILNIPDADWFDQPDIRALDERDEAQPEREPTPDSAG